MPPKKDKAKAAGGKAGRPMKDVLPPNVKPPREGQLIKPVEEPPPDAPPPSRSYTYKPYPIFTEWPGNQAAKEQDFQIPEPPQLDQSASSVPNRPFIVPEQQCFTDETPIYLPPSFFDFQRKNIRWCRPHEFLKLSAIQEEFKRVKEEKRTQFRRKSIAVTNTLKGLTSTSSLTAAALKQSSNEEQKSEQIDAGDYASRVSRLSKDKIAEINLPFDISVINYKVRDQTPEQMKRRKEEIQKQALADKAAKKKAPTAPKKGAAADAQEQQPLKVKQAIINSMDMGVGMPLFSKWATSQFQVIKDRSIRDCVSKQQPWQRIYPQNADGIPRLNPKGKYWVKIYMFGKE